LPAQLNLFVLYLTGDPLPVGVKRRSRYRGPVKFFKEKEQGEFNRGTLWDHTYSIGDDPLILPKLTTTTREMIPI